MNFVYSCRSGDNEELRYSIRSVKHFYPKSIIWVVGGKPDWYIGNYIEVKQNKSKNKNIHANLFAACQNKNLSNNFIYMDDDFFIFNYLERFNFLYDGTLSEKIENYDKDNILNSYSRQLRNTKKQLNKLGIKTPINYELHVPMPVEKPKVEKTLRRGDNFLWRSMYGNLFDVGGIKTKDVKIYKELNATDQFSSTSEGKSFNILFDSVLKNKFKDPTEHESDQLANG
jgi:hypothetical protein